MPAGMVLPRAESGFNAWSQLVSPNSQAKDTMKSNEMDLSGRRPLSAGFSDRSLSAVLRGSNR
jgi:hypothetical protein